MRHARLALALLLAPVPCLGGETAHADDYLAQGPSPWHPPAVDVRRLRADFVVAADGSGTHRSVQAAIDAVPAPSADGGARRWFVQIRPGTYRGPLCVQGKPPITLYGTRADPRAVTLVDGRYNALPKRPGIDVAQPCLPNLAAATHGTSGSATVVIASADALLAHLTIANDATERESRTDGAQAVALMTLADRVQLEDVRLVSHQDTFYVRRPTPAAPARVFVRGSLIEGDVDFVFGNATLVIDDSTLVSRAGRLGEGRSGFVLAPSTPPAVPLGFLVQRSRIVAEPGVGPGSIRLGRAWDEGVAPGEWRAGESPNGQALVRDSALGPHIAGWGASTSRRPFDASTNRFAEQRNRVIPSDAAREALAGGDGWASMEGGTRGGADAAPADVHLVHNRAELAAALVAHERPRIVKLMGRIDLSSDDAGRPLGAEAFRDPAFSWAAYEAAYDPATWGRREPMGPQEDARARSARAQAAQVVLKVPSRTTLIGLGSGAQIVNGGLLLDRVNDVILRNIHFRDAYDHFPLWDPKDNGQGEWNSEYDNLSLRGATHVWIDHCTFDDGDRPDAAEPSRFGRPMQHHDGLLDITRGTSLVTVSWSRFRDHGKTVLIGGGDHHTGDEGRLRVTLHHNLWEQTRERSPRVRFGQVHLVNNLYEVHDEAGFSYSIGIGHRADILSQANAWETPATLPGSQLARRLGPGQLRDEGSLHNGAPVIWSTERGQTSAWHPPYDLPIDDAADAAARVRAGAGVGRLWTGPPPPPVRPPPAG